MDEPRLTPRELMTKHNGCPWCDTCQRSAIRHEHWGEMHTDDAYPYGIPHDLDPNFDHEITIREWFNTPAFDPPGGDQ